MKRILYLRGLYLITFLISFLVGLVFVENVKALDPKTAFLIWTFEEGSGDKVKDLSGNGNDGIIKGTSAKWVKGKFGNGLFLAGANHSINTEEAKGVSRTYFSECLWVNLANFSTEAQFGYINCKGQSNPRFFYFSSWSSAGGDHNCIHAGVLNLAGAWGRGFATGRLFSKDTWYFLACVIDTKQGFIKTYVDGKIPADGQAKIDVGDVPGEPVNIWVGGTPENYQWINGTIDEVAFFNVALSEDDINSIMKNGLSRAFAVRAQGKLPITWATIKSE